MTEVSHHSNSEKCGTTGFPHGEIKEIQPFLSHFQKSFPGTFLVVQVVRLCLAMQGTRVQSLVGELRCHMLQSK